MPGIVAQSPRRRLRLACLAAGGTLAAAVAAAPLEPTPGTHTGPWYEPGAPAMADLRRPGMGGEPLQLDGRVLDTNGDLLAGARVELWHADPDGRYGAATHRTSRVTDARGRFGVRSVLPGHRAADRARHVHFVVTHPGHRSLVTRIYFRGDRNFAYALDPRLGIVLEQGDDDGVAWLYGRVEFVLEPAP